MLKNFVFNPLSVNTYLIFDETKECVIIDAACFSKKEETELTNFISKNQLVPVKILNTHGHFDHLFGLNFVTKTYQIPSFLHKNDLEYLNSAQTYASMFGFSISQLLPPTNFFEENQIIRFGNSELKVLHTPGHSQGCVCFYFEKENSLFAGDTLFFNSVGRTDLPGGNFEQLKKSIQTKLFTLPENTTVYSGHGEKTFIEREKKFNSFLK